MKQSASLHKSRPSYESFFVHLSYVHLVLAGIVLAILLSIYSSTRQYQYLVFLGLVCQFIACQLYSLRLVRKHQSLTLATWIIIGSLASNVVLMPFFLSGSILMGLFILVTIPIFLVVTNQLHLMVPGLFLTFSASAATILVDVLTLWPDLKISVTGYGFIYYPATAICLYLFIILLVFSHKHSYQVNFTQLRINLATQYALVISGITALVIILVTGVLITQIRSSQVDQVGQSFQIIAENFAQLAGSHLEQQMQKLQLITEQVPLLREGLIEANEQYGGDRTRAQNILEAKNLVWQGAAQDNSFIMSYLNNPLIEPLSRFRGHNSFHNDMILVDRYGGLVASLGQKSDKFYFYDQHWWQVSWNDGLGNIYIGDLTIDPKTGLPKLRIAIDIIDHSTNNFIGVLSSKYLLRTLIEDMHRYKPDHVEQISLVTAGGEMIATTDLEYDGRYLKMPIPSHLEDSESKSGWELGMDYHGHQSVIGYSTLSTAYNVISDPLHRLGWYVVISGTEADTLTEVIQSTKVVILVGLVAMALGVLAAIAAARVITRPIENLTATASAMSAGDLETLAEVAGPEELMALSEGFNSLTSERNRVINNLKSQAAQLAKAKGEAEAATKLKGDFLANMSHEIRTPLNAILGFAGILESSIDDEVQRQHATVIKTSGADLLHLINDILDLSKIEAGRMEIQPTSVDLRELFKELYRIFSISAAEKAIEIEMVVADDMPPLLLLDKIRLKQILFNLVGNGVKFTEEGKVSCYAQGQGKQQNEFNELLITIKDTGIGIDPVNYANVFETFKQHSNESSKSIEGTGLGLTISKNLIEMMGGTIEITGELGIGTTFTVRLPLVIPTGAVKISESYESSEENSGYILGPGSILIVDDLEINRSLVIEKLRDSLLNFTEAESGQQAIDFLKENSFDMVLMDIRMPGMDGYSALAEIRKIENGTNVPVIAITAAAMKEEKDKIQHSGFDNYLLRPFDQAALSEVLANYLPHHQRSVKEVTQWHPAVVTSDQDSSWECPPSVETILLGPLASQWKKATEKQNIPEIISFAEDVEEVGTIHNVATLIQYAGELEKHARSFDIDNVEKLLKKFQTLTDTRSTRKSDSNGS